MTPLQKKFELARRPTSGGFGFGQAARAKPKAMLLGVQVESAKQLEAAGSAGVDLALIRAEKGKKAAEIATAPAGDMVVGAWVDSFTAEDAASLKAAGCGFVACTAEAAPASAFDGDDLGLVLVPPDPAPDDQLRILAPLGLDGLLVAAGSGPLSIAGQLALVRLAALSSSPLLAVVDASPSPADLRVMRDSGVAAIVLPAGTGNDVLATTGAALHAIPPRRQKRDGQDLAIVPATSGGQEHDHEHDDDE